jgi:hypothetical protein
VAFVPALLDLVDDFDFEALTPIRDDGPRHSSPRKGSADRP